jgi:hypothetical protein
MHKAHFMSQVRVMLPIVLEHHEVPVTTHAVSFRDYLKDPDSAEHRFVPVSRQPHGPFDPWQLREEFLSLEPEHWEGFVEMAGQFGTFRISKNDFVEWQQLLRQALLRHPRGWRKFESRFDRRKVGKLFEPLPISFAWDAVVPTARIRTTKTLVAIIATIQLDVLRGAEFKVCARADCPSPPFKVETRHKIYCSPECAHLVAVRNSRARAAKNKRSRQTHRQEKAARG